MKVAGSVASGIGTCGSLATGSMNNEGFGASGRIVTSSTAEAIAVTIGAWAEAGHFGSGKIDAQCLAANLVGAIVKDPVQDKVVLQEYLETVVRERRDWGDLYGAIREVM